MNTPNKSRSPRKAWIAAAAILVAALVGACEPARTAEPATSDSAGALAPPTTTAAASRDAAALPVPSATPEPALVAPARGGATTDGASSTAALALLDTLPVKGRAPKTGYDRALFGQAWADDVNVAGGHNGCDTRNDILRRDLVDIELKPGSNGCTVQSGTLLDTYTGATIPFVRGQDTSSAVQIDHVVALSDAWQKGAQQLDSVTLQNFANDPRNLQAVDGPTNQQKGDGDAATWIPPNRAYRCTYVSRQIDVKAAYGLWVTSAERDAIARILADCAGAKPPAPRVPAAPPTTPSVRASEPVPTPAPTYVRAPADTPRPADTPKPAPPVAPSDAYYANCAAARAAGAAPLHAGQPGYRSALDRDGDGVACE